MPARQSKSTAKKATAKQAAPKGRRRTAPASGEGRARLTSAKVHATWKPVVKSTKDYVLNTFDSGIRLLMHKVPDNIYEEVHGALIDARNQVAVSLETLRVPPTKQDYNHLSSTLTKLKETEELLEQRQSFLSKTLDNQEKELQQLEDEKVRLQDFGKLPGKHHPILLEPLENELHLNINTVK